MGLRNRILSSGPSGFSIGKPPGGTDDVMGPVDWLERADIEWCAIGGAAVTHWAIEPMVTQDVAPG